MTSRSLNFLLLVGALLLAACGPASRTDALLNDVESYINEAPDSARAALMSVDSTSLSTRRLRARYSLLRTMAQDKCYDDITVPGLLDDAAWFEKHGTPDERMKLWFYRGRILRQQGDANGAAIAYSRAESYGDKVQDQHALGLLYFNIQGIYHDVYNRAKEQEYAEKAIEIFKRTGDTLTGPSLGLLAMAYQGQQRWAQADSVYREALPFIRINGKDFDPDATYAVVTNNFCAAGGDTYYAFASTTNQFDTGMPLDEILMEYITTVLGGVIDEKYAEPAGRITIIK